MNKDIDIILPIHNTALHHAKKAINSIAAQTLIDICIVNIILDSCRRGYKESVLDILNDLDIDYRIIEVNFKNLTDSLIYACSKTSLRYIARIDSDDWWIEEKLELQLRCMEKYNHDLISSSYVTYDNYNNIVNQSLVSGSVDIKNLSISNPICHSAVMFKRSVYEDVGGYDKDYRTSQDYDLWSRMYLSGYKLYIINEVATFRSFSENSISQTKRLDQKMNTLTIRLRFFKYCFTSITFLFHLLLNILSIFKYKTYEIFK